MGRRGRGTRRGRDRVPPLGHGARHQRRDPPRRRRFSCHGRAARWGGGSGRGGGAGLIPQRPFRRLAIVNRGEAAMRAIRAVRELNWERDEPIRIIALHTEPDRHALFVRQSDERYCLGPATRPDGPAGYLDYAALERALVETE